MQKCIVQGSEPLPSLAHEKKNRTKANRVGWSYCRLLPDGSLSSGSLQVRYVPVASSSGFQRKRTTALRSSPRRSRTVLGGPAVVLFRQADQSALWALHLPISRHIQLQNQDNHFSWLSARRFCAWNCNSARHSRRSSLQKQRIFIGLR